MAPTIEDIEFVSEGVTLRGWLYLPEGPGPHPAVVVSPGFGAVKERFHSYDYPKLFAEAGMVCLSYDHPNCGASEGEPRQEFDPIMQERGYKDAITVLAGHPLVDSDRIGIWGTSYSGGLVLGVAASDHRVRCVVSQVMTISGHANLEQRRTPEEYDALRREWAEDRMARMRGEPPRMLPLFAPDSDSARFAALEPPEDHVNWGSEVTVRSWELYASYEPAAFIERISPKPLLMIVATGDTMTPAADAIAAYERAGEPKRLVLIPGGHYAAYRDEFETTSKEALAWFHQHLGSAAPR